MVATLIRKRPVGRPRRRRRWEDITLRAALRGVRTERLVSATSFVSTNWASRKPRKKTRRERFLSSERADFDKCLKPSCSRSTVSNSLVHFDESQFEANRADGLKKLKPNAIPSIFETHPKANKSTATIIKVEANEEALQQQIRSSNSTDADEIIFSKKPRKKRNKKKTEDEDPLTNSQSVMQSPAGSQSASASADDGFTVVSCRKNNSANSNMRGSAGSALA
uniref:Uncharacterized protein n=1 Tax=Timema tahoe TaxID=61484 RepID=A0A7R9I8S9_9NEOP|nr:unnamed protein product [Timema tahoe]